MDTFCSWPNTKPPQSPQSPLSLGFTRDLELHYEFPKCELLGKGGFGVVHLVQKRTTGEKFACKTINKLLSASLASVEQQRRHIDNILREVAVLKKLKGSLNIVNLEAVYEDDKSVYIITECCFGGELIHTIGLRPYSESTVARIMKAVLRTLAQCHERGILHRDIKPGNFMFSKDDMHAPIKAIDFGLAVFYEETELPRTDLGFDGTPWFMAPEVLSSRVVPASDVWSAGVMAYQLLSGLLPFDDKKNRHAPALSVVWKSVLSDVPEFTKRCWHEVSDEAKDFIKQLLQKDPKKRPTAVEALEHPWMKHVSNRDDSTPRLSHTIVQRIQRFGQSSLFKRTVLDMVANELLQSYVEKTKYNAKQYPRDSGAKATLSRSRSGGLAQSEAIEVIKTISRRMSDNNLQASFASNVSMDDWEVMRKTSRLALDTSHHGSDRGSHVDLTLLGCTSPPVDTQPMDIMYTAPPCSPPVTGISLHAVLEEPLAPQTTDTESSRGAFHIKNYLESKGESLDHITHEASPVTSDIRTQRIEQFLKSMPGVHDAEDTRNIMEYLDFNLSRDVSESELVSGLGKLGYDIDEHEISLLVDIMAPGHDHVNFTQFLASQIDWASLQETHRDAWLRCVKHAFESIDKDGDGTLSADDIVGAIAEKLPDKDDIDLALEQAKAEACVAECNLSFEEFLEGLTDPHALVSLRNFDSRYNDHQQTIQE